MSDKTLKTTIQFRRDTTENWTANKDVVPAAGEPCFDKDTGVLKIGDGVATYENLPRVGGVAAAHYEGVKGDGESDTAVIERVLTAAGAEAKVDDIFVVKTLISDGKYSYTAYVYNGTAWGAMDGNYNAENVYFADDLTYTAAIGVMTVPSSGSGTIQAAGKNVKDVLASILAKEKNPVASQPAVDVTCAQLGAYEVGTSVTPAYKAALSAGSYTYGPVTGITATKWSVSNGTDTKETAEGTFDAIVVADNTNYAITATATHGEGAANGTVKFDGADVAVHGLGSAAYVDTDAFDAAGSKDKAIAAAKSAGDNAQTAVDALAGKVGTVAEGKTVVEMIQDAQAAATYDDKDIKSRMTTAEGKITTLVGEDASKSARAIAAEEVAKIVDGADSSYDTLKEIADWISGHKTDAAAMNSAIVALEGIVDGIGGEGEKATVVAYVTDAIAALKIGDYAKAADLTKLAGRVSTVEGKAHEHTNKAVLDGITAEKITAWDGKADADHKHDISDLNQASGYIVLNCGSASVNV